MQRAFLALVALALVGGAFLWFDARRIGQRIAKVERTHMQEVTSLKAKWTGKDCIDYELTWNWEDFRDKYPVWEDFAAAFLAAVEAMKKMTGVKGMQK